jgi:hypothetical protein
LYKILEYEFRVGKKWPSLRTFLAAFEPEFKALRLSAKSLDNFLHDLRDKCAHIKLGSAAQLGITGLSTHDADLVDKIMPILRRAVMLHLSGKYPALRFSNPAPTAR